MVFRTLVNLSTKRIPMIRFRIGGYPYEGASEAEQVLAADSSASTPAGVSMYQSTEPIEDWELPPRFWRKSIDPDEMAYINRGGPDDYKPVEYQPIITTQ